MLLLHTAVSLSLIVFTGLPKHLIPLGLAFSSTSVSQRLHGKIEQGCTSSPTHLQPNLINSVNDPFHSPTCFLCKLTGKYVNLKFSDFQRKMVLCITDLGLALGKQRQQVFFRCA